MFQDLPVNEMQAPPVGRLAVARGGIVGASALQTCSTAGSPADRERRQTESEHDHEDQDRKERPLSLTTRFVLAWFSEPPDAVFALAWACPLSPFAVAAPCSESLGS